MILQSAYKLLEVPAAPIFEALSDKLLFLSSFFLGQRDSLINPLLLGFAFCF